MRTLIKHGLFFIEEKNHFESSDLLIEDRRIVKISPNIVDKRATNIEMNQFKCMIIPGLIDLHCHLREPGQEQKETIKTGTIAAAKGGYTRVVAMGNTTPPMSTSIQYQQTLEKIKQDALISVTQAGTITQYQEGKELSEVFKRNLSTIYSDDGKGIQDKKLMTEAIRLAKKNKVLLILHEEDTNFNDYRSESEMLKRDLELAIQEEYSVHFTHLSSQESVNALTNVSKYKPYFTADTTPHHLFFSNYDSTPDDTSFKVNPPLLSTMDQKALVEAVHENIIQYIATDHAPHTKQDKNQPYELAPFGISGFETAFPACYTVLCKYRQPHQGLSRRKLIPLFTSNPAKLLGIFQDEGSIAVGKKANLTFIDTQNEKKVIESNLISKGKNTPFIGKYLFGWPILTMLEGEIVYEDRNSRLYRKS
jgi:dihydroorotase